MDHIKDLILFAKSHGVPINLNITYAGGVDPVIPPTVTAKTPKPPRRGKSVTGLSDAGLMALAAISNGAIDPAGMSLNSLAKALSLPKTCLYDDKVFRKLFDEYTRTGRMPRAKGIWDDRTGDFDVERDTDED